MLRQREHQHQQPSSSSRSSSMVLRNFSSMTTINNKSHRRRIKRYNDKNDTWNVYYYWISEYIRRWTFLSLTPKILLIFVFLLFIVVFWIYIAYCCSNYYYYYIYFSPFHYWNSHNVHQSLLRFQQDYYNKSNTWRIDPFPRWPKVVLEHFTTGSVLKDKIVDSPVVVVVPNTDVDYFNDLLFTIHAVLQNNNHSRVDSTTRKTSQLPYDTQPSFQNIYLITSTNTAATTAAASTATRTRIPMNLDTTLQLYKYTLPNTQTQMIQDRARYMESFLVQMLDQVGVVVKSHDNNNNNNTTKRLVSSSMTTTTMNLNHHQHHSTFRAALQKFGGILYVVSYTDSQFCCNSSSRSSTTRPTVPGRDTQSIIPILTLSAPILCQYAFPIPTYETIIYTKKLETSKRKRIIPIQLMDRYIQYPWWYRRYSQAVWRGSPTGSIRIDENIRWKLCRMSQLYPSWIDAKFVGTTQRWPILAGNHSIYVGAPISLRDMQQYRAIIDVDGNSWSSRFGTLLCQSSVVLKVQPRYVDYFYPTLQPWVHYIPIREDLTDLLEHVQFATSMNNTVLVQQIIYNANEWCRRHMTTSNLIQDMISIFDTYISTIMLPSKHPHHHSNDSISALLIPRLIQQYNFTRVVA